MWKKMTNGYLEALRQNKETEELIRSTTLFEMLEMDKTFNKENDKSCTITSRIHREEYSPEDQQLILLLIKNKQASFELCTDCNLKPNTRENLKQHYEMCVKTKGLNYFKCPICNYQLRTEYLTKRHITRVHNTCLRCGETSRTPGEILAHMNTCSGTNVDRANSITI